MSNKYSRREAMKIGLGGLASVSALGLAACDSTTSLSPIQSSSEMNLFFWGAASRDKMTKKAIKLFHTQNPNITITSEYTAFNNFWPKLNAFVAGGNIPELFQMDMRYLSKYVRSGLMLDLSQLIYDQTLDLSDFDPLLLDSSKANNSLYGIPLGGNYQCLVYDTVLLARSGVGAFPDVMSWEIFAEYMTAIRKGLGNSVYGTADSSGDISAFEIWVRQRGKELYTVGGELAFQVQDLADWFDYWDRLRRSGGCIPANIQAAVSSLSGASNSSLTRGQSVVALPHSNEFEAFQVLNKHLLDLHPMPVGAQAGLYVKPSQLISISARTPLVKEAAGFIDFIVNDPGGIKALGIERGIPGTLKARTLLKPGFTPAQLQEFNFTTTISTSMIRLKEVLDPPAASQVASILGNSAGSVGSRSMSAINAAKTFFANAQKALMQTG